MSYSNRAGHRPNPDIAPTMYDPITGEASFRMPFTPSDTALSRYQESKAGKRAARARARQSSK
jgi:hypothetical protein